MPGQQGVFVGGQTVSQADCFIVGDKELTVLVVSDEDGLDVRGANIPAEQLAFLLSSYPTIRAKNEFGRLYELSLGMDGESITVESVNTRKKSNLKNGKNGADPSGAGGYILNIDGRANDIKVALAKLGHNAEHYDQILGRLVDQKIKSLDDEALEKAFASALMPARCEDYVRAARECGLTLNDVYKRSYDPQDKVAEAGYKAKINEVFARGDVSEAYLMYVLDPNGGANRDFLRTEKQFEDAMYKQKDTAGNLLFSREKSVHVVLTIDDTESAAFVDLGVGHETGRILADFADRLATSPTERLLDVIDGFALRDVNGNTVGRVRVVHGSVAGAMRAGTMRLSINVSNAAFDGHEVMETVRVLRETATRVQAGEQGFMTLDAKGGEISRFAYGGEVRRFACEDDLSLVKGHAAEGKPASSEGPGLS